jgi:hypothetical protein
VTHLGQKPFARQTFCQLRFSQQFLANIHLAKIRVHNSHLAQRHFTNKYLTKRNLAKRHFSERHLTNRHFIDIHKTDTLLGENNSGPVIGSKVNWQLSLLSVDKMSVGQMLFYRETWSSSSFVFLSLTIQKQINTSFLSTVKMHNAAIISDLIFKTLLGSLNFFVGNVSFSAIGSKMRRNPSASDQRYKTFYCRKAPFSRTVVLLIFDTSDQFCQV